MDSSPFLASVLSLVFTRMYYSVTGYFLKHLEYGIFFLQNSCTLEQLTYLCLMDNRQRQRTIVFYKDYFEEFFEKQREKVKSKIIWTLTLIEELERIPETYLKHLENTDGLFEIRVKQGNDIFRIFCFF